MFKKSNLENSPVPTGDIVWYEDSLIRLQIIKPFEIRNPVICYQDQVSQKMENIVTFSAVVRIGVQISESRLIQESDRFWSRVVSVIPTGRICESQVEVRPVQRLGNRLDIIACRTVVTYALKE